MKKLLFLSLITILISCSKNEPEEMIEDNSPYKIELTSDQSIYTFGASIRANGTEQATLSTKVTDKYGNILNKSCSLTLNGEPFSGKTFKTNTAGDYDFQASIGSLRSNVYTISAYEIAEEYVTIKSSSIQSINSVGLVTIAVTFTNISDVKLKYVNFNVQCFNSVNDKMYEEITNSSSITCKGTGYFSPGETKTLFFDIGYFTGVNSINVNLGMVMLEDDSRIFSYD